MADITSNLVVYYPFSYDRLNYATGSGVSDNTNFGTTIDGANYQVGGGSLSVGNSKYLQMSNATIQSNFYTAGSGISVSFWIYATSIPNDSSVFNIGASSYGLVLFFSGSTLYPYYYGVSPIPVSSFSLNTWQHFVWTINTSGQWTIYKNGTQIDQYNQVYPNSANVGSAYINGGITIGGFESSWTGNLDEFRIYQRVLTATDVAALYNYTSPAAITANLVVYYPFDTDILNYATGTGVSDSTNFGSTIDTSVYKIGGGSVSMVAASSQYLQMNNITTNANFFSDTVNTGGISFSLWINYAISGANARIIDIGDASSYQNNCLLYLSGGTGLIAYVSNSGTDTQSIGSYTDSGWKHIVWTLSYSSGSTSTWTVYVDGVQVSQTTNKKFPAITGSSLIGKSNYGAGDGYYNGYIDDFRIYQRVLTATEALALYNYTGPGPEPSPPENIPCFREGTQILCFHNGKEQYLPVEKLRTGTLVKTLLEGYLPIDLIGKKVIDNPSHLDRIEDRLYLCSKEKYPELFEDLYITGGHSILVDQITEEQKEKTLEIMEDIFITDNKYRLLARIDGRAEPFAEPGKYTIYHFALENDNYEWNYGVYANGLLVESCSKEHLELFSGMEII